MLIADEVGRVNGMPIWRYLTEDGYYLVREYGTSKEGKHNYIIKSPSGRLYCFSNYNGNLPKLFLFIKNGKAAKEKYACDLESIYDEF